MSSWYDLRYGLRLLRRRPGFSAAVILTLSLGIGANAAIFSAVRGILLKSLPFSRSEELIQIGARQDLRNQPLPLSVPDYQSLVEETRSFAAIALLEPENFTVSGSGDPISVEGLEVSPNYFEVFTVPPLVGSLNLEDPRPGKPRDLVLSYPLWRERFGSDPSVLGSEILIDRNPHRVIGVVGRQDGFPPRARLWVASEFRDGRFDASKRTYGAFARLKPETTIDKAQADLDHLSSELERRFPESHEGVRFHARPLREALIIPTFRLLLLILTVAVAMVLLIACVNCASLLLVRANGRQREMSIRVALGAGRLSILKQLMCENLVLALMGGLLGTAVGYAALQWLLTLAPPDTPRLADIEIDVSVLLFTAAISLLSAFLFGFFPALQSFQRGQQGLGISLATSPDRRRHRMLGGLVIAEIALSMVLLVLSGLMIRAFTAVVSVEPGFDPDNKLIAQLSLPTSLYPDPAQRIQFYRRVLEELRSTQGIGAVSASQSAPVAERVPWQALSLEGQQQETAVGEALMTLHQVVADDYLASLGLEPIAGRGLSPSDYGKPVALINETLARRFFLDRQPLDTRLRLGTEPTPYTIVGVYPDLPRSDLDGPPRPETLTLMGSEVPPRMNLIVQGATEATSGNLPQTVRRVLDRVDPAVVVELKTVAQQLRRLGSGHRTFAEVLGVLSVVGLALAGGGISAVVLFVVGQRSREIAVRRAIGADPLSILSLTAQRGVTLLAIGLVVGVVAASFLSQSMKSLLFGVAPTDLLTYAGTGMILVVFILGANLMAASRALAIDPAQLLRVDD